MRYTRRASRRAGGATTPSRRPAGVGARLQLLTAVMGAVLAGLAAWVTLAGNGSAYAWLEASARAVVVGTPIAAGLCAWRWPTFRRFGALLVGIGAVAFVATLSESSDAVLYSIGRLGGWCIEPLLLYTILAFPSGRMTSPVDRALVRAFVLLVLIAFVPTALVVEQYPLPWPWTLCHGGCPGNALMLTGTEPAGVDEVVRPVRELLMLLIYAAAIWRVAQRLRTASHLMRRALSLVLGAAAFRLMAFAVLLAIRMIDASSEFLQVWIWTLPLGVPLLALAFLAGLFRWRLFVASGVQRLGSGLPARSDPEGLRRALAEAFDDPDLELVYRIPGRTGWFDTSGRLVRPAPAGPGRSLTEIRDGERVVAALTHDGALGGEPAFVDAATAYAVMTLDNHRLAAEAGDLLAEVQDSRTRIQTSADDERRRIERELHDGAQQRLVALRIKLELAAERIDSADHAGAELVRELGGDVDSALDEVRSLARGIYPAPLADRGLAEALRSAAMQAALPTTVLAAGVKDRYPREVESAAYFACMEALQNVAKHAHGASAVVIDLSDDGALQFEVRDDGAGFDPEAETPGVGVTSMHDRVAAVGGELAVVSAPGQGTRIVGRIPLGA